MQETLKQSPNVLKALAGLSSQKKKLLELCSALITAEGKNMYPVDLLAFGAAKRSVSTAAAFRKLVKARNILCSRALIRMQIDTATRFFSVFLVNDPHSYSIEVLSGKQINHLKDSSGKTMTDKYLVEKLNPQYPWLQSVYDNLCGYIHLSADHYSSALRYFPDDSGSFAIEITEQDFKFPEASWLEMVACFKEATDIFMRFLEGWVITKRNPTLATRVKAKLAGMGLTPSQVQVFFLASKKTESIPE